MMIFCDNKILILSALIANSACILCIKIICETKIKMVKMTEMVEMVEIILTWTLPKVEMAEITLYHVNK